MSSKCEMRERLNVNFERSSLVPPQVLKVLKMYRIRVSRARGASDGPTCSWSLTTLIQDLGGHFTVWS